MFVGIFVFLACIIILLIIPVHIVFSVKRSESFQLKVFIGWMFGIIRLPLSPLFTRLRKHRRAREKRIFKKRGWSKGIVFMRVLKIDGFSQRLLKFLFDLFITMKVRILSLNLRIGLDDPADTGQMWAFIGPLTGIFAGYSTAFIRVEPVFDAASFFVDGKGEIRIIPVRFLVALFPFLVSRPTLKAIWEFVVLRRHT